MSRSRASTPAGKRRTSTRGASRSEQTRARPKRASQGAAAPKRAKGKAKPPKRTAPKRGESTRGRARSKPATRRSSQRRAPARRRTRRAWSRPRPLAALRRGFGSVSWRYRLGILAICAATIAAGYLFWLRDSSLVAVTNVDVVGLTSGDREQIVGEITRVAEQQTTLHVDAAKIERVATGFPTVESVSVDPNFPHGMRIEVNERPPALVVEADGQELAAAADGTLLAGVEVDEADSLPVLELKEAPGGASLEGDPLQQALILGATPPPLRPLVEGIGEDKDYGVEVTLRGGIPVRFGSGSRAAEKWASASAVLASPKVDALTYLDVRVPERPATGGGA